MGRARFRFIAAALFCAIATPFLAAQAIAPSVPAPIRKLFRANCTDCHSGASPSARLNLDPDYLPASILGRPSSKKPDFKIADPAAPEKSYILMKLRGTAGISGSRMPRGRKKLSDADIQAVADWLAGLKAETDTPAETKIKLKIRPSGV
jgi:mono/diheme cytochrome c family protein